MIIFGWRTRLKLHTHDAYTCPVCHEARWFRIETVRRWFTLFFVPVLPLNLVGTYATCQTCGVSLKMDPAEAAKYLTATSH